MVTLTLHATAPFAIPIAAVSPMERAMQMYLDFPVPMSLTIIAMGKNGVV